MKNYNLILQFYQKPLKIQQFWNNKNENINNIKLNLI
jgi:hypothetical protein